MMAVCAECGSKVGVKEFRIFTGRIEILGDKKIHTRVGLCEDHYPDVKLPTNKKYQPKNCKRVRFCWLHS